VVAGVVYIAVGGTLFARSAATGAAVWSDALTTGTLTTPLVTGAQIYLGASNGTVYDIGTDGTIEWGADADAGVVSTPAYGDGGVYVTTRGGTLVGLDATSGLVDFTTTVDTDPINGSPLFADGIIYVAGDDAYAFNATDGSLRWESSALWLPATSAPAIDNGTLFVYDGQYAWAFDAGDGTQEWKQYLPSGGPSGPVHAANGVVYAEETSFTFALAESTGARLRTLPSGGDYSGALIADGTVTVGSVQGFSKSLVRYALPTATSSARPDPARLRPDRHLHRQD
jgi:outer membrane protein assembly factor BamB